jgi:hypothetical protein
MNFKILILQIVASLAFLTTTAQRISYSETERDDNKRTDFDILGKIGK